MGQLCGGEGHKKDWRHVNNAYMQQEDKVHGRPLDEGLHQESNVPDNQAMARPEPDKAPPHRGSHCT